MPWGNGWENAVSGFNLAQAFAGQQASHLAGMYGQLGSALQDENDSRVAQEREFRRQEHEKSLLGARSNAELQMLIERLRHERWMAERQAQMSREMSDRQQGVLFSTEWSKPIPYA